MSSEVYRDIWWRRRVHIPVSVDTNLRRSDRLKGLDPEFGPYIPEPRKLRQMPAEPEAKSAILIPAQQQYRNPSVFNGDVGQDPSKWLQEYDRVSKFNRWDDTICLANVFFFLDGTARQWYENNEDKLISWDVFKSELKQAFGEAQHYAKRAEDELKYRAQKSGESTQSYIQSVLGLCHQVKPDMSESEKVSHLMKGVAENVYRALLTKEVTTTKDFITWCRKIEEMQQKRIRGEKFERLPNVVPMAAIGQQPDLVSLIRQIVKEEVQRLISPVIDPEPQVQSIETIVREEVESALAPLSQTTSAWTKVNPRRQPTYNPVVRRPEPIAQPPQKKTDIWRTADSRPVCFHCGRPGHVVRYCRERKAVFDTYRANRRDIGRPPSNEGSYADEYSRPAARTLSPSPLRGRSPTRRYRSPSPYRRSSQSPSRKNEEN